jgi:hypothetical protein
MSIASRPPLHRPGGTRSARPSKNRVRIRTGVRPITCAMWKMIPAIGRSCRTTISSMRPGRLQVVVLLFALLACALQTPLLAPADTAMSDAHTAMDVSQGSGQPMAEPCCAMQAALVAALALPTLVLAAAVLWLVVAGVSRPLAAGVPPHEVVSIPGLRGRPLLHAYLN